MRVSQRTIRRRCGCSAAARATSPLPYSLRFAGIAAYNAQLPMSTSQLPEYKPKSRLSVRRSTALILALFVWLIVIPFAHGVIPWAISTLMPRYGWTGGEPGIWNYLGLILVSMAGALLLWLLVLGLAHAPRKVTLGLTPQLLMTCGPYKFTRNPMYVAELSLWLGWAIFLGSIGVLIGFAILSIVVNLVAIPREERTLEGAFGQVYLEYKHRVPRWFGKGAG